MDPAYLDYLLFAAGGFAATALGFAIAWLRSRDRAIRAEARLAAAGADATLSAGLEARFDRQEQMAEASSVEVERVAEAQRFLADLLSARTPESLPRR